MSAMYLYPQGLPVYHYRWAISSLSGAHASTTARSLGEIHTMISNGEGAEQGKTLLVVRSDGVVTEAYAGSRLSMAKAIWVQIPLSWEQ